MSCIVRDELLELWRVVYRVELLGFGGRFLEPHAPTIKFLELHRRRSSGVLKSLPFPG